MRALSGLFAALAILACLAATAEAGRSGSTHSGIHSKRMFGQIPPFTSHHARAPRTFLFRRAPGFFNPGPVPPFTGTIVPPFTLGTPIIGNRFFNGAGRFNSFFATGFTSGSGGRTIIILIDRVAVPVSTQAVTTPPVKAQIINLDPSPKADKVQIFSPTIAVGPANP